MKSRTVNNAAEVSTDNGEIEFIAARNARNLNGWTYDVKSLQAQTADGDYVTLTNENQAVAIPLMVDHSASVRDKIGVIDSARVQEVDGIESVVMHAKFFGTDEAQDIRKRILSNQLTDVSITTDWGDGDEDESVLKNSHIIEVSVVYAGAEPKAKILVKNAVKVTVEATDGEQVETELVETEAAAEKPAEDATTETDEESEETPEAGEDNTNEDNQEENAEMPTQTTNATNNVATKEQVVNALVKLAQENKIKGKMSKNEIRALLANEVTLNDGDNTYVVPDATFAEILQATRDTDLLGTFRTLPGVKRFTLMSEARSEEDLARAGRWSKGDLKTIQNSDLNAQKLSTQFIYKMQELSYEDEQEDFGALLLNFINSELPQKLDEEEERAYIVGDGRNAGDARHISSIVSLDAAAEDATNVHATTYDGTLDSSVVAAIIKGSALLSETGTRYAVFNKQDVADLRLSVTNPVSGLPASVEQIADAMGVDRIFERDYVPSGVAYVYVGDKVRRLTGPNDRKEQYDIDYNNRKIEVIRRAGGAPTGLYSAVKVTFATSASS